MPEDELISEREVAAVASITRKACPPSWRKGQGSKSMNECFSRAASNGQQGFPVWRVVTKGFFLIQALLFSMVFAVQLPADVPDNHAISATDSEEDTSTQQSSKSLAPLSVVLIAKFADAEVYDETFEWTIINTATEEVIQPMEDEAEITVSLVPGAFDVIVLADKYAGEQSVDISAAGLRRFVIELTKPAQEFGIEAPESASAGSRVTISWNGPNLDHDYLFIVNPMVRDNLYYYSKDRALKASEGPRGELVAPAKPGTYEIRYFSKDNGTVAFRRPLEVTPAQVDMTYPHEVSAGSEIKIVWSGPGLPGDRIFVAALNMANNSYVTQEGAVHKVESGPNATIIAPFEPGEYEIRYYSSNNAEPLARFPVLITKANVTIDAPRMVVAGTEFNFNWTGPNAKGDFLFVAKPELDDGRYFTRGGHRTADGPSGQLVAPTESGNYEIRYYSKTNGRVLARRTLVIR
jgi:Ca-activated chloride channel family protein